MKKKWFSRIQVQLVLTCGCIIFLAFTINCFFSISEYRKLLMDDAQKHAIDLSIAIEAAIDTYISSYDEFSRNTYLSDDIHTILDDTIDVSQRLSSFQKIYHSSFGYKRYMNGLYLISNDGNIFPNIGWSKHLPQALASYDWYKDLYAAQGKLVVHYGPSWLQDVYSSHNNVVTVGRLMKSVKVGDTASYYQPTGVMIFELSPLFINSLTSTHDLSSTELILTDQNNLIIFDSTQANRGKELADCYPALTRQRDSDMDFFIPDLMQYVQQQQLSYGWILYLLFDSSALYAKEALFVRYSIVLALILLFSALIISFVFSRNIVHSFAIISNSMKEIEAGHLDERLHGSFPQEMEGIVASYNHMLDSLQKQTNENYVIKLENLDSKYKALEAQINPHFIFNVLEMVNSEMILTGNSSSAKKIRSLAKMIRYNLDNNQEFVSLDMEMKHIGYYCSLLQEVYPDYSETIINLPEQLKNCKLPSHCIQPLVENAVKHGFTGCNHQGILRISVQKQSDRLLVTVWDNGNGISKEKMEEIYKLLSSSDTAFVQTNSIGLINVHRRLRLKYGPDYGLQLKSTEGTFTEVTIVCPIIDS